MLVRIARQCAAEMTADDLFEVLGRKLNANLTSVIIDGKLITRAMSVEVQWSDEVEEREL